MSFILIALIRLYQLTLSKVLLLVLGPVCRFEPSCSRYAIACLESHGALRGSLLSAKRLCRCHPFHPGGYDPPPPPPTRKTPSTTSTLARTSAGELDGVPEPTTPSPGGSAG